MIDELKLRNLIAGLVLSAAFLVFVACGQDAPESSSSSVEEPKASEVQEEVVEVVESVPDLPAAPDFTLPAANRDNTEISLSQFQGDKPVVLVFYRAYW